MKDGDLKKGFAQLREEGKPSEALLSRILLSNEAKALSFGVRVDSPIARETSYRNLRVMLTTFKIAIPVLLVALVFTGTALFPRSLDLTSEVFAMEIEEFEIESDLQMFEMLFESEADMMEMELFFSQE